MHHAEIILDFGKSEKPKQVHKLLMDKSQVRVSRLENGSGKPVTSIA